MTPTAEAGPDTAVGQAVTRCLERTHLPEARPARVLLMLSGGLDSVALLATLLATTEHDVHAHHIELDNPEERAVAEQQALDPILEICRTRYRGFETSESTHRFPLPGGGWDTMVTMFTAAKVTRSLGPRGVDVVITGHIRPPFSELSEGEAVFHAAFQSRRYRPAWVRPLAWLSGTAPERKADIYESLPRELAEAVWYCRRPVSESAPSACGECHACRLMVKAHEVRERRTLDLQASST